MKRLFQYAILAVVALATGLSAASCSDDDDDKVKNYDITVNVTYPDDLSANDIESLVLTLTSDKGTVRTITLGEDLTARTVEGIYSIVASGKIKGENYTYLTGKKDNVRLYEDITIDFQLEKVSQSPLIFKTLYVNGGYQYYIGDSFAEVLNNSDEPQSLDKVFIVDVLANHKAPTAWQEAGLAEFYPCGQSIVAMFPDGITLQPGQSIIVARKAQNHTELGLPADTDPDTYNGPVSPDLSNADYEVWLEDIEGDVDNLNVPNMVKLFKQSAYSRTWFFGYSGGAYLLAKLPADVSVEDFVNTDFDPETQTGYIATLPGSSSTTPYLLTPSSFVLDAVEICAPETDFSLLVPHFTAKDDTRPVEGPEGYSAIALQRKVDAERTTSARTYYKDTNNSSEDFNQVPVNQALGK